MGTTSVIIAITIAVATLGHAAYSVISSFLKVKNAKNITLIKRNSQRITISTTFNKDDSKKLANFGK